VLPLNRLRTRYPSIARKDRYCVSSTHVIPGAEHPCWPSVRCRKTASLVLRQIFFGGIYPMPVVEAFRASFRGSPNQLFHVKHSHPADPVPLLERQKSAKLGTRTSPSCSKKKS